MKVEYSLCTDGTREGRMCLEIVPETDFEKTFIERNKWKSSMSGNPVLMVEKD
jgi:hypothetical protein